MPNTRIAIAVAGTAFLLVAQGTAHAAKGVKKAAPANTVARMTSGIVTGVAHQNGGSAFHVRTAQHHKKLGAVNQAAGGGGANGGAAGGVNQRHQTHTFHVTGATRFGHQSGAPASAASLRRGERVRVQATGNQATAVMIMSQQHRMRGNFTRHRANGYRPHLYHYSHGRRR